MNAQQLKNSILQMAVQGKLIPQDPTDEPADVLLARIREEKQKIIKEGKIKKDQNESIIFKRDGSYYEKIGKVETCIDEEIPFEIPQGWVWSRLGSVCEIARGGSPRPIKAFITDDINGINWIKISDSEQGGKYINSTKERIKPEGVSKSRFVHKGDFLLTNSMSFGRPYILNVDGCIHDGWLVLSSYNQIYDKDFLYHMLSSCFAYYQFCSVVSGAVVKNLNTDKVSKAIFPIPPLEEQHRIVQKLKELEPNLEEYSTTYTSLNSLNKQFPDQLKKSILQHAVQGQLVDQDSTDEPADVLLARIREEKQRLIKEGKIKKDKNESIIFKLDGSYYERIGKVETCIDEEIPFEIPDGWSWSRLSSICTKLVDGTHNPPKGELTATPFLMLSSTNINNNQLVNLDKVKYLSTDAFNKEHMRTLVAPGDILFTSVGSLGRSCVYTNEINITFQRSVTVLTTCIYNYYLKYYLDSPFIQQKVIREATGTAQKGFYLNQMARLMIPIPPLEEQCRIADKIKELLHLVEEV